MDRFTRLESLHGDIRTLSDCFSDAVVSGLRALFPDLNEREEAILRYVTGWVYFIDAVDDLEEDLRKQKPNPFLRTASSREELLTQHEELIRRFADERAETLRTVAGGKAPDRLEDRIIASVLNRTIPETTRRIFSQIPGYPSDQAYPPRRRGGVLYG